MPVFASFSSALALLCVKIFFCRILDVSLSTVRTILSVRGKTLQATAIGFFETLVWFLIVREALASDAGGLALAVSYAGGFAAGTFVGGQLANLLIRGDLTLQVITSSRDDALLTAIREAGFAISVLDVNGSEFGSEKYLLIAVMKSNRQKDFRKLLQNLDPHAFILANETKYVLGGVVAGRK